MFRQWPPYVPVAERRQKAARAATRMAKKGENLLPVHIPGRQISGTFWGQAWCRHLEAFSDFENRLPRGRSYVRSGAVIHLDITKGKIEALVQGSSLYKVAVRIRALDQKKWSAIRGASCGRIDSLIELLQGRLSSGVMQSMIDREQGLFPKPKEMTFTCSCPDWADMCKHVAAVLYGVGHRLDHEPALLFSLRDVDHLELMEGAKVKPDAADGKAHVIRDSDLSELFGVDISDGSQVPPGPVPPLADKPSGGRKKRPAKRKMAGGKTVTKTARKARKATKSPTKKPVKRWTKRPVKKLALKIRKPTKQSVKKSLPDKRRKSPP